VRTLLSAALLLLPLACSTSPDPSSGWPRSGDACQTDQLGFRTCGIAGDGDETVLRCEKVGVDTLWVAIQECPLGCAKAACLQPDAGPGPDTSGPTDAPVADGPPGDAPPADDLHPDPLPDTFCTPGEAVCLDIDTRGICTDDGSEYAVSACPEGQGCVEGYCFDQVCIPGAPKEECFDPVSFLACNESGTNWDAVACPPGLTCFAGECVAWQCEPGAKMCKGLTAVQECQETQPDQFEWVIVETCSGGLCKDGECIGACEANLKLNTYLGCNYWATDLDNIEGGQLEPVGLVVSAPSSYGEAEITVTDTSTGLKLSSAELGGAPLLVQPGQLQTYLLPPFHDLDGSGHTKRSFRIDATQPVTVHQFNPLVGENVFTNDASLLLPDYAGGTEHLVMSWKLRTWVSTLRGFATVVATQPGSTNVTVTAAAGIIAGPGVPSMVKGQSQAFVLEQGDVLNLEVTGSEGADLTGTHILSDKKVAVFGGHECANIHVEYERCDHIEQQLFPVAAWGTTYLADPFHARTATHTDTWRILAGQNGVTVTLDPPVAGPFTLNMGQWVEFDAAEPFVAKGSGKFLLGHYLQSCNYPGHAVFCTDTAGALGIGDPAFTLAVPVGQYLEEYVFLTPQGYTEDYVNVLHQPGAAVLIDGQPLTQPGVPVGQGEWVLVQEPVEAGVHTVTADSPVGVTAYGYGCHVSYAYPGGLKLEAL
jgi:hypothetical protein